MKEIIVNDCVLGNNFWRADICVRGQKLFSMHNLFLFSASWAITVWADICAGGVILMVLTWG
jgi:hypothetical protein